MTRPPLQTRRRTHEEFIEGADTPSPAGGALQALPVAAASIGVPAAVVPEAEVAPAPETPEAPVAPGPLYAARAPKVHDKDSNFQLKMKPELANKVERAFELRDPNVFASRQEMLQKMLAVALDAYIQSRS